MTIRWAKDKEIRSRSLAVTLSQSGKVPRSERKFLILLSKELKRMFGVAVLTILHELVHVAQWDQVTEKTQHGREFNARMKQLAAKGAFVGLW